MGSFAQGIIGGLAGGVAADVKERRSRRREDEDAQREVQVKQLTEAIKNTQARGSLQPNQPGYLPPDQVKRQIEEAQKALTSLYAPHEAPALFEKLRDIFGGNQSQPMDERRPIPGEIQLRPGMTVADILAASGPVPDQPPVPKEDIGQKFQAILDTYKKQFGGDMPEELKQAMFKHVAGGAPLEPKPVKKKGLKIDTATGTVFDQDEAKHYTAEQVRKGDVPEEIQDEATNLLKGYDDSQKKKQAQSEEKFKQHLKMMEIAFEYAEQKGDHQQATKIYFDAKNQYITAVERMDTMDKNLADILKTHNQQAMLSLTANHIGMTLGAQKNSRITRAAWDEAVQSAPWIEAQAAKWFHTDPATGDLIFDGFKGGVTLTDEQAEQMVELAHQKVDTLSNHVDNIRQDPEFRKALGKTAGGGDKPKGGLSQEEQKLRDKLLSGQ